MHKCFPLAAACLATLVSVAAHAEPAFRARSGVSADGQGNAQGVAGSGFSTSAGGQGLRTTQFNRTSDGAVNASNNASATTRNGGIAERSGSWTRSADGSASGERSTTMTSANTGVTFDASTTYTKGSGVSRSATCKDAAGNSVSCGSR